MAIYSSVRRPQTVPSDVGWTNTDDIFQPGDGKYAYGGYINVGVSARLAVGYDLPFPDEAVIYGIQISFKCHCNATGCNVEARLTQGGTTTSGGVQTPPQTVVASAVTLNYGHSTFLWGRAWTAAMLRDPAFQADIVILNSVAAYFYVDCIEITVWSDHGIAVGRPPTATQIAEAGAAMTWSSPQNAALEDSLNASGNLSTSVSPSDTLTGTTLGVSVPADAEVLGVRLRMKGRTATAGLAFLRGSMSSSGAVTRDSVALPITASQPNRDKWVTMPQTDLKDMWGVAWKPVDVNWSGLTINFRAVHIAGSNTVYIDAMEITVLYKEAKREISFDHGKQALALESLPVGGSKSWQALSDCETVPQAPLGAWGTTLQDEFSAAVIDTAIWRPETYGTGVSVSQTGGAAQFVALDSAPSGSGAMLGMDTSGQTFDWSNTGRMTVRWTTLVNKPELYMILYLLAPTLANTYWWVRWSNGWLHTGQYVNGVYTDLASLNRGTGVTSMWWRVESELSGNLSVWWSDDGVTWNLLWWRTGPPFPMTALVPRIDLAKNFAAGSNGGTAAVGSVKVERAYSTVRGADDFDDAVVEAHWTVTTSGGAAVSESGGALKLDVPTGASKAELRTTATSDVNNSMTHVRLVTPVPGQDGLIAPRLRWEVDADNYVEITLRNGWLNVNESVAGMGVVRASHAAVPTHIRIRAEHGEIFYEWSTQNDPTSGWGLIRRTASPIPLEKVRPMVGVERYQVGGVACQVQLDNWVNVSWSRFSDAFTTDSLAASYGAFSANGASLPNVSGGTLNMTVPTRGVGAAQAYVGVNVTPPGWEEWDLRDGEIRCKVEMPAADGTAAMLQWVGQMGSQTPNQGAQVNQFTLVFRRKAGGVREVHAERYISGVLGYETLGVVAVGQDTVHLRVSMRGDWARGHVSFDAGVTWVLVAEYGPAWPPDKGKSSGLMQMLCVNEYEGNTAGTIKFDDFYWGGRGDNKWPQIGGLVASGLTATLLQSVKPSSVAATSSAGAPKVVAGIHLETTGIESTAVVPSSHIVKLAGVLRPFSVAATSTVGSPRVPTYLRMNGRPPTSSVGQPVLIREAPVLPPQPRVEIRWTILLCDQLGNPLEDISSFALDKQLGYRLNRPEVLTFRVPSDHRLVNELAPDGRPNLAVIRRTVKAYRAEIVAGVPRNVLRFVGWVWQLQDEGDADNAWTTVSVFGPMQRLARRMCVNSSGSVLNANWTATDGGLIVHSMLSQLNAGAAWAHSGIDTGTREPTDVRTVDLTNLSVSAAIVQLTSAFNGFDVNFVPLDNKNGHLARLDIMSRRGTHRTHSVMGWGIAPHNVQEASRLLDAETYANSVVLQGWTPEVDGARPIQAEATNADQQQDVGIYRTIDSHPDVTNQSYLQALATEELGFRSMAREIVSLRLQPGRAPEPFSEWDLGDTVPLYVGVRQRGGYQGRVRIYGFDLELDNEGREIVSSLVLSPEGG